MTKPTQETLLEAVISAIEGIDAECQVDGYATEYLNGATDLSEWEREVIADAAIETMFERLRKLPNEMADSIAKKHFVSFEVAKLIGRDIATAFQQENSDATTD